MVLELSHPNSPSKSSPVNISLVSDIMVTEGMNAAISNAASTFDIPGFIFRPRVNGAWVRD